MFKAIELFLRNLVLDVKCRHPIYSRDYKLNLLAEQDAVKYYQVCLNCGRNWDE